MSDPTDNTSPGPSGNAPGVRLTVEVAGLTETWEGPLIGRTHHPHGSSSIHHLASSQQV
ncbi:MAG: hypothetical protein M3410_10240 [Acidobacteriota bacterium]|nr:hypothetical protein [Acidobacteriota bacterium]